MKKTARTLIIAIFMVGTLSGCGMNLESIANAFSSITEDFTPEQEHYLGRAVAAKIVQKYPAKKDNRANNYLNQLGQSLTLYSKQPFTYGGYHFLLLDSSEINAFAAPDGLIFVTTGMVGLVSGESELAAVLAHEIAHVQNKDAVSAIKASRMTEAALLLGKDAVDQYAGGSSGAKLLNLFSGSVDDIVNTLVSRGYSRSQEYAADAEAKEILTLTGYRPEALDDVLRTMERRIPSNGTGLISTHPPAADRLAAVKSASPLSGPKPGKEMRDSRFKAALGKYSLLHQ